MILSVSEALALAEQPSVRVHRVPAELLVACAKAESSLDPLAVRVEYHRDGTYRDESRGLMQILVSTALELGAAPDMLFDPLLSFELGAKYLRKVLTYLNPPGDEMNRWLLAVAGYNAGMGRVDRAIERSKPATHYASILRWLDGDEDSESSNERITRRHVARVRRYWNEIAADRDHEA